MIRTCLCLIFSPPGSENAAGRADRAILLGYKKTGFGAGRWVGIGGHIEDGEQPAQAAVREVAEETHLVVPPDSLTHVASLTFVFPARPSWDQTAEVFATSTFTGEPAESDEVVPRWFSVGELPFDGMWDDAKYWIPVVLGGDLVVARITFAADCATVAAIEPDLKPARLAGT
jgi:8-oxo-dGTP diphosphatase